MMVNKDYVAQTFKIRADLAKRLDDYKYKTGVSKTFVVEKALELYLHNVGKVNTENLL